MDGWENSMYGWASIFGMHVQSQFVDHISKNRIHVRSRFVDRMSKNRMHVDYYYLLIIIRQ